MATPHIEAQDDAYAPVVLLPGDPLRAEWISRNFFKKRKIVNSVRNCLGYTGEYKGIPISVQGGGMGQASNAIYIHELYKFYGVQTIIRVGSAGAIANELNLGDIVAATTASTDSNMTKQFIPGWQFCPTVSFDWLKTFSNVCPQAHIGGITSNDWFYQEDDLWWFKHQRMGVLAVEMETHVLYALANNFNRNALSVCTISDHLAKNESMSSVKRQTSFNEMIESVLATVEAMC
jgi:purine-nucleoside phosphorylase